jgi:hypothetical protein
MKENLLTYKPKKIKNDEIKCVYEDNKIVIIYPKKFGRIEEWVKTRIGGTEEIRRPLDKFTTFIWEKCDGVNNIAQIISKFDRKFGEEVAPADVRVQKFIKQLLELNLISLNP